MGGAFFSKPWRTFQENYEEDLNFVKGYRPQCRSVQHLRILLHGPVAAGKSSFINSVNNLFQGRITGQALTDGIYGNSFTQMYKTYKIRKNNRESYNFVFNDIRGLEDKHNTDIDNLKLVLKGHVRDGYKFNPDNRISENDAFYNADPTLSDKVHVLVFVLPADKLSLISETMRMKMRDIRLAASEDGIPQFIILTKIDECSPKVKKDINHVHLSRTMERKVAEASVMLGIQPNCIFLVQNNRKEIAPNEDMNTLILFALKQMIGMGEDYLNNHAEEEQE